MKTAWMDYKDARHFVISHGISGIRDWDKFCRSGQKPLNIPSRPHDVYRDKGWEDWGSFFATFNKPAVKKANMLSFTECRELAISLNIKSSYEWGKYIRSGARNDIPACPNLTYKKKGWVNWSHFLGKAFNVFIVENDDRQRCVSCKFPPNSAGII